MVGLVRLREAGETPIAPVEVASVDDEAADGRAMAADVLGGGVDDDVRAMLERAIADLSAQLEKS
mgnify:CR=1 FL=1